MNIMTTVTKSAMTDKDLSAYFARIGYTGDGRPTLETLAALHVLHPQAIPFENLWIRCGNAASASTRLWWFDKLVSSGRGGYCYEQKRLVQARA